MWRYAVVVVFAIAVGVSDNFAQTGGSKQQYPAAVFAYGEELTPPFSWEGIGEEQLFIVDGTGRRVVFFPRPTLYRIERKPLTAEQKARIARAYELRVRADSAFVAGGIDSMYELFSSDNDIVSHVERKGTELILHLRAGGIEVVETRPSRKNREVVPWTKTDSHNSVIRRFEESQAVSASIWFGTDHYRTWKARVTDIEVFRQAVKNLEAGVELSETELTFMSDGLRHDLLRRKEKP